MYGTVSFSRFKWDGAKQDIEIRNWKKKLFQVERFVRCEIDENISRAGNWSYEIKFVYRNCKQDIIILLRWNIEHKIMIIILNVVSRYSYWNTLDRSDSFLRSNDFFINLKVTVASSYPNISVIICDKRERRHCDFSATPTGGNSRNFPTFEFIRSTAISASVTMFYERNDVV